MPEERSYMIRKRTVLIGNTSFRTETFRDKDGVFNRVKVRDIVPNKKEGEDDGLE